MNYLTIYLKNNDYYFITVSSCFNDIGYVNKYDRKLISIQYLYRGRYYTLESYDKIKSMLENRISKHKKRYILFKKVLYLLDWCFYSYSIFFKDY